MNNLFSKFTFGFIEHLDGFEKFSSNTQPMYHWMQMKKKSILIREIGFWVMNAISILSLT